jgi:hypothetical protein
MVDSRIYRALLVLVAFAVIVFGFSLQNQPGGVGTALAPGQFFSQTYADMWALTHADPDRAVGSAGDQALAKQVQAQLTSSKTSQVHGFQVSTQAFNARTARGNQIIENVVADRPGLGSGDIVIVASRDATGSPGAANMSGTAVLISLAQALSGETLNHTLLLVSTSGQIGAAGATQLANTLAGQPVDAVIVLGDLAGASHRNPVVVPWSAGDKLAPPMLRNTVTAFVKQQTGIATPQLGLAGQYVRLAFPFSITQQAPFAQRGIPAVLLSVSGDLAIPSHESLAPATQIANMGTAVLQTINALDKAPTVPAPSSYLLISGKLVPLWAVRLLVLALILPVGATVIDALARTRRRGHSILRWLGWVVSGAVPFLVGLVALLVARAASLLSAAPPGAVGAHGVPVTTGDVVVLVVILGLMALAFVFLRPLCLKGVNALVSGAGGGRRPESPAADAAAVALTLVMTVIAVVIWALNPFSALLLVPALHLWMWLAQPAVRTRRWVLLVLLAVPLLPVLAVLIYYADAYGLTPVDLVWSGVLMVAGGAMPLLAAVYWTLTLGCVASALVIALRASKATALDLDQVVTVRGPATYAGPGSLGGTKSAIRR